MTPLALFLIKSLSISGLLIFTIDKKVKCMLAKKDKDPVYDLLRVKLLSDKVKEQEEERKW